MKGTKIYFASSTKPPRTGKITIWATDRIKLETDFEYTINNALFDLEQEKIRLLKKIISIFATETPTYLLFTNNRE